MKKLCGFVTLIAVFMGAIPLLQTTFKVTAAPPSNGIKNVVLVHGAFADGSGWEGVANILKKDGYNVSVVQHPETSFAEDVKFTKSAIDRQSLLSHRVLSGAGRRVHCRRPPRRWVTY